MGLLDWKDVTKSLSASSVKHGVPGSQVFGGPNGNEGSIYVFNSIDATVTGTVAKFVNLDNFNPTGSGMEVPDGGGEISLALKKFPSSNSQGFSVFGFFCLQGGTNPSVDDTAYILGLSGANPYQIVLAKGPLISGLVDLDLSELKILRRSSTAYSTSQDIWLHLQLSCVVQNTGDVSLLCFQNNLNLNTVLNPVWNPIPGMPVFIDDLAWVNTKSAPLLGGCCGFGYSVQNQVSVHAGVANVTPKRAIKAEQSPY